MKKCPQCGGEVKPWSDSSHWKVETDGYLGAHYLARLTVDGVEYAISGPFGLGAFNLYITEGGNMRDGGPRGNVTDLKERAEQMINERRRLAEEGEARAQYERLRKRFEGVA